MIPYPKPRKTLPRTPKRSPNHQVGGATFTGLQRQSIRFATARQTISWKFNRFLEGHGIRLEGGDAASWLPPIGRRLRLRSRNRRMDAVRPHGIHSGEKHRGCVVRAKVHRRKCAHPWIRELPRVAIFGTSSCWGHDLLPIAADKVIDGGSAFLRDIRRAAFYACHGRFGNWVI